MMISARKPALSKWEASSESNSYIARYDSSLKVKPLPPFGKQGIEYLKEYGKPLNGIWIISGDSSLWGSAWGFAKLCNRMPYRVGLVYPSATPPEDYSWPVNGCECLLWLSGITDDIADRLGKALLTSGAVSVKILQVDSKNNYSLAVYGKEASNGA